MSKPSSVADGEMEDLFPDARLEDIGREEAQHMQSHCDNLEALEKEISALLDRVPHTHSRYRALVTEKVEFIKHWRHCLSYVTTWN